MDGEWTAQVIDPVYVVARAALLDALDALGEQRDAVVLVGAQAIYLHTGDTDIAVPAFTTDGDLAIEPARLKPEPKLAKAMERAHFRPGIQPGSWICERTVAGVLTTIPVDLMVPEALAGVGRRAARLGDHGARVGRRARGLEGALVDNSGRRLTSLDPDDQRAFEIRVAGPGALMVSKLHKLAERSQEAAGRRVKDKDALDVLRILRAISTETLVESVRRLQADALSAEVTREAMTHLAALFGSASAAGAQMVIRATERLEDPAEMARSCEVLANELLQALKL
ncbi:MAG: hypothetical protein HY047_13075 [Acidobacteria bacterium]|nr:hypothetical protein [Acidobacteriota bacterium]